jgi:ABC-type Mn2+/Zn2+ transport system ATPase subunit
MSEPLVVTRDLALGYDGRAVVQEVNAEILGGERVAVLGSNGGGKTTLFRGLLGELRPLHGTIEVQARPAAVPQTERSRLDYPVSALDVVLMGTIAELSWWRRPGSAERSKALAALAAVGLEPLANRSFGELSGGQRQRVLVARALVQDARVLLLDEPFTGLDATSAHELETLVRRLAHEGRTVLIATHDLEQARRWDKVLCLNRHQIAFGRPAEALSRSVLERTYGGAIVELPGKGAETVAALLPAHHHD